MAAIDGADVNTVETLTSTSYADLATAGPSVTLLTGSTAYVDMSAVCYKATGGAGFNVYLSYAVSGATTVAASDANGTTVSASQGGGFSFPLSRRLKVTGLTPGTNTFTLKYKVNGHSWSCYNRSVVVQAGS